MTELYPHETSYRGAGVLARLQRLPIAICGAGALGANLAESLCRCGAARLTVIDRDRVEPHNLSTQPYGRSEVGVLKARALANALFRALGVSVQARSVELTADNRHKLLRGHELVIDCFDNSSSRALLSAYCRERVVECLHAGMSDAYGEVQWAHGYRVPGDSGIDGCDYPLARNLVMLTASLASEAVLGYVESGVRRGFTVTLRDLSVQELP